MSLVRRPWLSVLVICGAFVVLLLVAWMTVNSLRDLRWLRSPGTIQRQLVRSFPKGTPESDIRRELQERGAALVSASTQAGCLLESGEVVGSGHLSFALGGYKLLLSNVDVTATFCFDAGRQLLDIEVKKYRDAP